MRSTFGIPVIIFLIPLLGAEQVFAYEKCTSERSAKLESLQGDLLINTSGQDWQRGKLNDLFCEGSKIKLSPYGRAMLSLPNGIILRLAGGTEFTLAFIAPLENTLNQSKDLPEKTVFQVIKGFIHFISRTPKHLEVRTPIANAGPIGTEFAIRVDSDQVQTWVFEGKVKLSNGAGKIELAPNQSAQALKGQSPNISITIKPEDAVNWSLYYPPLLSGLNLSTDSNTPLAHLINDFISGSTEKALDTIDELIKSDQNVSYLRVRAAMRLMVGQAVLAGEDIQQVLTRNPEDAEALALDSVRVLTQNNKEKAYELAIKAVEASPSSAVAYSALSYAEQARFNLDKALNAANQAVKNAPSDAMAYARKAELELSLGDMEESAGSIGQALKLNPNVERTQTIAGFSFLLKTEISKALDTFNRAISLDSTAPLARLGLALTKIRLGNLNEGRKDLEMAASLEPSNSLIRSYLGKAYYEERRSNLSDDQFKLAKEFDPKDPTPNFYDAINKQITNRPIEALEDIQRAIELNDNRAVYRSNLQLDKDLAARQVGLGRIYNTLGFDDVANRQAVKSLINDPTNYTAHRLLSDSDAAKPRGEIVRSSELLQAQLLQPVSYNQIQPRLSYIDLNIIRGVGPSDTAFNEYNKLYEANGARLTTTGVYGSNNTIGDESVISGIYNDFSYSLGQLHYNTDGFRQNNNLKNNLYNVFLQYKFLQDVSFQFEYRNRETRQGDLQLSGSPDIFDPFFQRSLDQDTYRYGIKISTSQNSDLLISFLHANRTEDLLQNLGRTDFLFNSFGQDFESQYLFHNQHLNIITGGGFYLDKVNLINTALSGNRVLRRRVFDYNINQYFGYIYSNFDIFEKISIISGVSLDFYNDTLRNIEFTNINPKFGLIWQINNHLVFRAARFKAIKSSIISDQLLQPTQVAGFDQFFDDFNGTKASQYAVGVDANWHNTIFSGVESYVRYLSFPIGPSPQDERYSEELYRFYFNWNLNSNLVVNTEFKFENFRFDKANSTFPRFVETASLPLEIRFFSANGIFTSVKGTYIDQNVNALNFDGENFSSSFYLVDAAIGYRFPKSYGLISFEAKNLFDTRFTYRDRQFQLNEQRLPDLIPERLLFARLTINF